MIDPGGGDTNTLGVVLSVMFLGVVGLIMVSQLLVAVYVAVKEVVSWFRR